MNQTRLWGPCLLAVAAAISGCATEPNTTQPAGAAPKPATAPAALPAAKAPPAPSALAQFETDINAPAAANSVLLSKSASGIVVLRAGGDTAFTHASTKLSPKFISFLEQLAQALQAQPKLSVVITGHTDNVGNTQRNEVLSAARAKVVMAQLIKLGVAPERLAAEGKGKSEPIASNDTAQGRTANRRVDILVSEGGR